MSSFEGDNRMDTSDFLVSAVIGAVGALVGIHLFGLSGTNTEGNEQIKGMTLEQLMARKEKLEDFIAEYLAALKSENRTVKGG